jgi:flagellar export protein FliJ
MKAFHFRLERVLEWRQTEFELAEHRLREAAAALGRLDEESRRLSAGREAAERAVRTADSVDGADLVAHSGYLRRLRRDADALAARRVQLDRELAARQQRLIEARRRLRIIEKCRERRLVAWEAQLGREIEAFAGESYLARWNSRRSGRKIPPPGR